MKYFFAATFISILLCTFLTQPCWAQEEKPKKHGVKRKPGLKAGLNFFSLQNPKLFNGAIENNTGFMVGGYYSIPSKKAVGFRTEVIFSRQGYDYTSTSQTGTVKFNYIVLPQLTTLNISRFLQVHFGGQVAFLLDAKVDSSGSPSSIPGIKKVSNIFNNINYGFAGGLDIKPIAGLIIGGRYNLFLNMLNKANTDDTPSYVPKQNGNLKNGLLQLYVGYEF